LILITEVSKKKAINEEATLMVDSSIPHFDF